MNGKTADPLTWLGQWGVMELVVDFRLAAGGERGGLVEIDRSCSSCVPPATRRSTMIAGSAPMRYGCGRGGKRLRRGGAIPEKTAHAAILKCCRFDPLQ